MQFGYLEIESQKLSNFINITELRLKQNFECIHLTFGIQFLMIMLSFLQE